MQRWTKPTDRAQRVDEKNVFICKGMYAIFQKKGKKMLKKDKKVKKYLKIWAKMYKIGKYFEKGQVITCNYCTQ